MGWFNDLLQGIPLNAVLKERVALAEQKFKDMEQEKKRLEEKVAARESENADLKQRLSASAAHSAAEKPKVKWGCYVFEGDTNLYCPACYDTKGKKHLTTRASSTKRT